jgi:hypothetical protein
MRIAADIVNVVTLMILLYMPSKSTMLFPDWTKKISLDIFNKVNFI